MAFGPTGDATCLRLCARLSIPANARACPHIKPSRRPFRLSALCSNRVEQLPLKSNAARQARLTRSEQVCRERLGVEEALLLEQGDDGSSCVDCGLLCVDFRAHAS